VTREVIQVGRSGVLPVDKGAGLTSFQVVAHLRRVLRAPKIGHGGTLDPAATGLLPILVGEATKLTPYLVDLDKEYLATVRLGVMTDCPNPDRSEGLLEAARGPQTRVLNIDHHPDNRRYGTVDWIDPSAAATGEMVFDLVRALGLRVTPAVALNLFTAIHTDTGSFRYSNTTPRTFRIAAELAAAGADPALVSDRLYQQRAGDSLVQLGEVLRRVEISDDGQVAWLCVPRGLVSREFLEAEDLVGYPRSVRGVKVAVLFSEEAPGKIKASLRGKGDVPVNAIAHRFGGGGHENAAGCTLSGTLAEASAALLKVVRESLGAALP